MTQTRTRAEVFRNIRMLMTNARATLNNGAAPIEKRVGAALACNSPGLAPIVPTRFVACSGGRLRTTRKRRRYENLASNAVEGDVSGT